MKLSDRNSRAASEYAEKKKQQLARANQLRLERDEISKNHSQSKLLQPMNTSDSSRKPSVSFEHHNNVVSHIVIKQEIETKHQNRDQVINQREYLPVMPSLGDKLMKAEGKSSMIETTINGNLQSSYSNRNFMSSDGDSSFFFRSPSDPSGRCIDLCDRPIICGSTNSTNEVVIGSSDHALYSINVMDAKRKHVTMYNKKYGHTDWVTGCCHLPDGRVVSCAMDSKICVWNRDRRSCVDLFGHQGSISKVVSDAQFNTFFSCGYDGKILGWNLSSSSPPSSTQSPTIIFSGHGSPVLECAHESQTLVSGTRDGVLCFWNIVSGQLIRRTNAHKGQVTALQTISSEPLFISAGTDGMIKIWDTRSSTAVQRCDAHCSKASNNTSAVSCVEELQSSGPADVGYIATGGANNTVCIFDPRNGFGSPVWSWTHHNNCVYSLCAASDSCVFSGDGAGMMLCYDALRGVLCYGIGASSSGAVKTIFKVQNKIITGGEDGKAIIFEYL